jgi:hypothetical protein
MSLRRPAVLEVLVAAGHDPHLEVRPTTHQVMGQQLELTGAGVAARQQDQSRASRVGPDAIDPNVVVTVRSRGVAPGIVMMSAEAEVARIRLATTAAQRARIIRAT